MSTPQRYHEPLLETYVAGRVRGMNQIGKVPRRMVMIVRVKRPVAAGTFFSKQFGRVLHVIKHSACYTRTCRIEAGEPSSDRPWRECSQQTATMQQSGCTECILSSNATAFVSRYVACPEHLLSFGRFISPSRAWHFVRGRVGVESWNRPNLVVGNPMPIQT